MSTILLDKSQRSLESACATRGRAARRRHRSGRTGLFAAAGSPCADWLTFWPPRNLPRPGLLDRRATWYGGAGRGSASSLSGQLPGHDRHARLRGHARHRSTIDYIRVTPDPIDCEAVAPTTTATLDPAAPATGDTYDRAVKVNLSATDGGTNAVGRREDRVPDHDQRRRRQLDHEGQHRGVTSPFVNQLTVSSSGTHLVEFRSTDKAANTEETKSVTFKVQLPVCDRSDEFDGTGHRAAAALAASHAATAARPPRARSRRR